MEAAKPAFGMGSQRGLLPMCWSTGWHHHYMVVWGPCLNWKYRVKIILHCQIYQDQGKLFVLQTCSSDYTVVWGIFLLSILLVFKKCQIVHGTWLCCERRVLMAVDISMCFKMDISMCRAMLNEDFSSLVLQGDVWGLCWTCSKIRLRFTSFLSRKLLVLLNQL